MKSYLKYGLELWKPINNVLYQKEIGVDKADAWLNDSNGLESLHLI